MRLPPEQHTQEARTAIGDHANPPLMAERTAPRFELIRLELDKATKLERERQRHGVNGDEDSWNAGYEACARQRDERSKRLLSAMEQLIAGEANALYGARTALELLQAADVTPDIRERLDQMFFYAALVLQRSAKLMGKDYRPPMNLNDIP